ncbi:EAL domain-containing protein [Bacillaceae bacterium Marseille-Q3522]|nr:EAL domain-containing protein [Bacillaceae bacterium Marseille-Q3522]
MDALDILTDLDNVVPFFQPIFSADEHKVIGYEILGRYFHKNSYDSLGSLFLDKSIPEEYRLEIDQAVLKKALEKALSIEEDILLFVNRDADLLLFDEDEQLLSLLMEYHEKGIDMHRIVIEITDQTHQTSVDQLDHLLSYYRTFGIKFAIDKLGKESSNLERIGQLSPDILKIDLLALRSTNVSPAYQDILYSLSLLARKIGATLLFENIEMVYQLQFAWKNGGRYYQGYYLKEPVRAFVNRDVLKEKLREKCHQFILHEKKKLEILKKMSDMFQGKIQELVNKYRKIQDYDIFLLNLTKELDGIAFRMYVCDEDGFQKSSNALYADGQWILQPQYHEKNWSWRPYFLENISRMQSDKKGILSDLYSDIENGETIRTFSYPLNADLFLFIDLSYLYLYEHDGLLF